MNVIYGNPYGEPWSKTLITIHVTRLITKHRLKSYYTRVSLLLRLMFAWVDAKVRLKWGGTYKRVWQEGPCSWKYIPALRIHINGTKQLISMQGLPLSAGDSTRMQPLYFFVHIPSSGMRYVVMYVCVCKCVYLWIQCMCECVHPYVFVCVYIYACNIRVCICVCVSAKETHWQNMWMKAIEPWPHMQQVA